VGVELLKRLLLVAEGEVPGGVGVPGLLFCRYEVWGGVGVLVADQRTGDQSQVVAVAQERDVHKGVYQASCAGPGRSPSLMTAWLWTRPVGGVEW